MSLRELLIQQIATSGPMTIAEYMHQCLMHPRYGYYATRDPFGASGDFITAPEISQMFGELVGLSLAQTWLDQGAPAEFLLVELGPGRGTLMKDILRATRHVPGFSNAQVHLIETSAALKEIQKQTLGPVIWHDNLNSLPDCPAYFVANEFFDALPVHQFVRRGAAWAERCITVNGDDLAFALMPPRPVHDLSHRLEDTAEDDIVEFCRPARTIACQIGEHIENHGGAALIFDYGEWRSLGNTLQALKSHNPINPLETPGQADLTTHVDFEMLAQAAPCAHTRLTPQGVFLERLGITERAQILARQLDGPALKTHVAAHRRLTHPEEMGTLFKTMGFYSTSQKPPPGLEG
ncbi:class I SAM-dependent methyltransferase [Pseudaestuariivita rosea]|uniref:class I SAM-dependent methyltransferase n=1 Tax=Pseudaestuariivita rosea TaxID=2763263 RepID=UPI001ABB3835|nr:SAM-dependent methyltransferase [Pseudaestuariivita rosea]